MKINLECGQDLRTGYININSDPLDSDVPEGIDFRVNDYRNLDPIVEDESVEELVCNGIIHRLYPNEILQVLAHYVNKLVPGGMLKLTFLDIRHVAREGHLNRMSLHDLHNYIFGSKHENKTIADVDTIKTALTRLNLNINSISMSGCVVSMEAIKK